MTSVDEELHAVEPTTMRRAARMMRDRAEASTVSSSGRWVLRRTAGYPQSIVDDASAVLIADTYTAPTATPDTARHILAWDPEAVKDVASLLDAIAYLADRGECPAEVQFCAAGLAATWLREGNEDGRRESLDGRH